MMTPLKMWCFLPLAVLLLLFISPTETKVVQGMAQCEGFLLNKPPQVPGILEKGQIRKQNQYKLICQTYENKTRFVTLYDTKNKIPVFSAYKYKGDDKTGRPQDEIWKIEPQLENMNGDKNMEDCDAKKTYTNQAGNNDYKNNKDYNRGHLFPSSFGFDKTDKISTFTLTNIVPQAISFNSGSWKKMENYIKCILENYCENNNNNPEGYVVTGAKANEENKTLNNRVNIPSMLWSAFCCYSQQNKTWIAGAFMGDNVPDKSKTKYLQMETLEKLYNELSTGNAKFEAFPESRCPLNHTPEDENMKKKCEDPLHLFTDMFYKDEEAL
uniref:Endonuclease domain-containing 1 protein-like n=1 Tax=Anabas testudineus TaxID=64144 RepID=A0AAQ6ID00_ANATE